MITIIPRSDWCRKLLQLYGIWTFKLEVRNTENTFVICRVIKDQTTTFTFKWCSPKKLLIWCMVTLKKPCIRLIYIINRKLSSIDKYFRKWNFYSLTIKNGLLTPSSEVNILEIRWDLLFINFTPSGLLLSILPD